MPQDTKIQKLLELRKQYLNSKAEAVKTMNEGDLKTYFEKLTNTSKLKKEFSETLNTNG